MARDNNIAVNFEELQENAEREYQETRQSLQNAGYDIDDMDLDGIEATLGDVHNDLEMGIETLASANDLALSQSRGRDQDMDKDRDVQTAEHEEAISLQQSDELEK